jgi:pimeloyl-ACP methyl ester carboxylesterase
MTSQPAIGIEHWTNKGDVRLFPVGRVIADGSPRRSSSRLSMASQPTFDLTVPGRPDSSVMDWFAKRGFVCWCVDMEGYGRSDKKRDIYCDIANGADDLAAATTYIGQARGTHRFMVYGISSGALRAALFAQRHPDRVARLALDAFVWTAQRRAHARAAARSCRSSRASGGRSTSSPIDFKRDRPTPRKGGTCLRR